MGNKSLILVIFCLVWKWVVFLSWVPETAAQTQSEIEKCVRLGEVFLEEKQYRLAEIEFKKALVLAPKRYMIYLRLAEALYLQGKKEEAVDYLSQAIKLFPTRPLAYKGIKFISWNWITTQPQKALKYLQDAIQPQTPQSIAASIYRRIAYTYNVLGEYEKAIEEYQAILDKFDNISPEEIMKTKIALANLYYENEEYEHALKIYNTIINNYNLDDNTYKIVVLSFLGCIYFEKGEKEKAYEFWHKVSLQEVESDVLNSIVNFFQDKITVNELLPQLATLHYTVEDDWLFIVGMRLEAEGKLAEAKKFYKKSLEIRKIKRDFPYLSVKRALERIGKKTQSIR